MDTIQDSSVKVKEIRFQIVKTPEEYRAVNISSKEIAEKGLSQRELITKLVSKLKKQTDTSNECKVYFLNAQNKVILSRQFKNRKYSRFKKSISE
jgi:hypothetical protein